MFENIIKFFKNIGKKEEKNNETENSKDAAKERLHLVLMQDRANVSADFLELMKQEIIEVIKKYIDVDEKEIDVHLTNKANEDGTVGAPALYANIPIVTIKNEARKLNVPKQEDNSSEKEQVKENKNEPEKEEKEEKVEETEKVKEENEVDSTQEESKETENTTNTEENKGEENKEQKVEDNISEQENKETETSNK